VSILESSLGVLLGSVFCSRKENRRAADNKIRHEGVGSARRHPVVWHVRQALSEDLPARQSAQFCASYNTPRFWSTLKHPHYASEPTTADEVRKGPELYG
jgi:hypothetical protein